MPHDPAWAAQFEVEKDRLARIFDPILKSIHHVGSTAVPGLPAKPVIDTLVIVSDDTGLARFDEAMRALHYTPRGECLDAGGTPGRFYYSKTVGGLRTHHVHVCRDGHFQIRELLRFGQYLRENPAVAAAYGDLKAEALQASDSENAGYMARKDEWIHATVRAALAHYGDPDLRPAELGGP